MATILIVDDRPTNRELFVTLLGYGGGHRLLEAAEGEEGLVIARAERPDLIITDIVMPTMDGYEFAHQVRADPAISKTQIIFYTSSSIVAETRRLAAACGVSTVIGKPIEPQALLDSVQAALDSRQTPVIPPNSEEFHREHMRLLTDTLAKKVDELEAEISERKRAEEELHKSEETYRFLFENNPLPMWVYDLETLAFLAVNDSAVEKYGYTREEFLRMTIADIRPMEEVSRLMEDVSKQRPPLQHAGEWRHRLKDGTIIDVEITSHTLQISEHAAALVVGRDITERKRSADQLNYHARLLRHISDAVIATDDQLRITAWNRAAEKMYGWTSEEVMGQNASEILSFGLSDEQQAEARELLKESMASRSERIYHRRDGRTIYVEANTIALTDEHGKMTGYVSVNRDITERKQAEMALQQAKDFAENIIQTANVIFLQLDTAGNVMRLNTFAEEISGYSLAEVEGKSWFETLVPRDRYPYVWEEFIRIAQRGETPRILENPILTKQGDERYILWKNTVLREGDRIVGTISFGMDITDRKRGEEALAQTNDLLSRAEQIGHIGSWAWDISADRVVWSDGLFAVFGLTPDEFGATYEAYLNCVHPDDRERVRQTIEAAFRKPEALEYESRILRPDGQIRTLYSRAEVVLNNQGAPAQLLGIGMDITERKQAEEQIQLQIQRLKALRAIDTAISSSFNLGLTLDILLDQVIAQLNTDAAAILLFHPVSRTLEHAASRGFRSTAIREVRLRLGEGYAGKAVLERRIIHIPNLVEIDSELNYALSLKTENFIEYYCVPLIVKGEVQGVLEIFHRSALAGDPDWLDFLETLAGQAAIAIENATLFEDLQYSNNELFQAYDATIEGWSHALDLRDKETEGHSLRVTEMTMELARKFSLPDEQLIYIRWGALLHDIGKMGIPDSILLKPDKLTDEEWERMRQHPGFAFEMLSPIIYLNAALDIPYCHHEKWDGTGYPRGLKGEIIPLAARLFAVVDVWDALRSDRPYRLAWSKEKTIEHIQSLSGTHFDPKVTEYFLEMIGRSNG